MSAYMMDKEDIDKIVATALHGPIDAAQWLTPFRWQDADGLGDLLVKESLSSIHYRYPDTETSIENTPGPFDQHWLKPYKYEARDRSTRDAAVSLVRCYEYQSCEHPEWETSHAHKLTTWLRKALETCQLRPKPPEPPKPPAVHYSITEVAKLIRVELKKHFPETQFSVRSKKYSMGSHIDVHYTDGPPAKAVEAVIGHFHGKTFDGMDDSTHYHDTEWNGQKVHFAGSRPSVYRSYSREEATGTLGADDLIRDGRTIYQEVEEILCRKISYADWNKNYQPREDSWRVLSSWDARWETLERAVERWITEGCRR